MNGSVFPRGDYKYMHLREIHQLPLGTWEASSALGSSLLQHASLGGDGEGLILSDSLRECSIPTFTLT